jgi:hypothetical protein
MGLAGGADEAEPPLVPRPGVFSPNSHDGEHARCRTEVVGKSGRSSDLPLLLTIDYTSVSVPITFKTHE